MNFGSVLLDKSFTIQQKIRWIVLLVKTKHSHRMSKIAAAITTKTAAKEPVILDIGANVGLFTKGFMSSQSRMSDY